MGSKGRDVIAAISCYVVAKIGAPRMTSREYLRLTNIVIRGSPTDHVINKRQIRRGAAGTQIPRLEIT